VIEQLIFRGVLKLYDPRVTEEFLTKFCARYGALIKTDFLDAETRDWLAGSMDLAPGAGKDEAGGLEAFRKHALVVRTCEHCGRAIRGNVFFRHVKRCAESVRAAWEQCHQDRQVPRREQPLVGLDSSRLGGTRDETQTTALREILQVLDADSREVHDLCISKEFLACFDSYHGTRPLALWSHLNFKMFVNDSKVAFAMPADLRSFAFGLSSRRKQPVPHKYRYQRSCRAKANRHGQKHLSGGDIYFGVPFVALALREMP
jgi:hypothetical protein